MDAVGRPLAVVTAELAAREIPFTVAVTRPDRLNFPLLDECLYVVRQTADEAGVIQLTAAAKMGRQA
jgi:hypothetical protein